MLPEPLSFVTLALAQAISVADTVVTISAAPTGVQRWIDWLTSIASVVIALALIALSIALIPAAWNSRKIYKRINDTLEGTRDLTRPFLRHAETAADNVDYITTAIRSDVEQLKRTVDATQARLEHASAQMEERINHFNALLKVVQEEAEDLFIDTASTLRGVRAGARALQEDPAEIAWDDEGPPPRPRHPL